MSDCVRDDSTECDCPRCAAEEERFWREQGGDDERCIGADCVNPHPFHGSSECETVEMHEAHEAEADDSPGDLSLDDYLDRMVAGTLTPKGRAELAAMVRARDGETAEAIAAWIDRMAEAWRDDGIWRLAAEIRSGAWRR